MKSAFYLLIILLSTSVGFAQQHPNYTQYTLNRFALNPAVAGIRPCAVTTFGNRKQWIDFENAPNLYFASFQTRFNKKDDQFPKNFHGGGVFISNDRIGFYNYTIVKLAYAYHIKLSRSYHFSVGMFAGIHQQKTSFQSIRAINKGIDPAFDSEEKSAYIYPEISPGGFIYNRKFYLGLSMYQMYPARIDQIGTKENRLTAHYFFMGGYRFRGKKIHFSPSTLISFSPFISPTVDLTLTTDYKDKISIALGSKYLNSAYATLQFKIANSLSLGYSYEYALNEIAKVAPTTHEIVLQFATCYKNSVKQKVLCPAYQ